MIWTIWTAWALPLTSVDELRDAATHATGVIERCRVDPTCAEGTEGLAEAFVVLALSAAVVDGVANPQAAANARALDPVTAGRWGEMLAVGSVLPEPWVVAWEPGTSNRSTGAGADGMALGGGPVRELSVGFRAGSALGPPKILGPWGTVDQGGSGALLVGLDGNVGGVALTAGVRSTWTAIRREDGSRSSTTTVPLDQDLTARSERWGTRGHVGIGAQWGSTRSVVRFTVGPMVGVRTGRIRGGIDRRRFGFLADPTAFSMASRLSIAGRRRIAREWRIELRASPSLGRVIRPESFTAIDWSTKTSDLPDETLVEAEVTLEVQGRVAQDL